MITDSIGRVHDYLRISLTDVCNFRCSYCMPDENIRFMPSPQLMQKDEILEIAHIFVEMGVRKIRLTGGEPLARKDTADIIQKLSALPVELTITTNGARLHEFVEVFNHSNIRSLNISLDTLHSEKFLKITRRNVFNQVWANIQTALLQDWKVKINVVIMRGVNEDEILDFVEWTLRQPVQVRFIEFMPFTGNQWQTNTVFTYQEILDLIATRYEFEALFNHKNETAKNFKLANALGTFAVISTMSAPFCAGCNRMRLTADGKMKNCLFSKSEVDILSALRKGEDIRPLVLACVQDKAPALGGQFSTIDNPIDASIIQNRSMINIGG